MPEKEEAMLFQTAGGTRAVTGSSRSLRATSKESRCSRSAMSERDNELRVSFDDQNRTDEVPLPGEWKPIDMWSGNNNVIMSDDDDDFDRNEKYTDDSRTYDDDIFAQLKPGVRLPLVSGRQQNLTPVPALQSSPGPGQYVLPRKKCHGGRVPESYLAHEFEVLQRAAAKIPGPGQYAVVQHALPEGGRFNKHTSKTVFDIELIPTRDIPGPGTYDNLRQVFPSDPAGIRIDLSDRRSISKMREIIKQAEQVPGPGVYEIDIDSVLARQRRIVDKAYAVMARKTVKRYQTQRLEIQRSQKVLGATLASCEKRSEFSNVKDAIKRFASDLRSQPSTELPDAHMLCGEILECAAAQRALQQMHGPA
eukprot:CAMPEP_0179421034 /NCGR_PEP_ID=MMETSP0799-20121207/9524_1 /TAXON_ID=46947 /ORGANISM="Geminigera cryophila, Strain CCMP2564" /LENGTH=363 /DNA_ID=CAMNT_0021194761 /DNA_START=270 /DNA_END=1361 /DNA_ORIENTATION=+